MTRFDNPSINAGVLADSISASGVRLVTVWTKAPKFLDAEIEKHRMISSNSSSSRAIPLSRTLSHKPFMPDDVRLNQPGMQGYTQLDPEKYSEWCKELKKLHKFTANIVEQWNEKYNIHKQTLNRYLEPFSMQSKVMTANMDQWNYFFSLRISKYADPSIQKLARKIRNAILCSKPNVLKISDWHTPYLQDGMLLDDDIVDFKSFSDALKCSVARCARVSYTLFDGSDISDVVAADVALFDKLVSQMHLTPLEHVATPLYNPKEKSGNFAGWKQYRKMIEASYS